MNGHVAAKSTYVCLFRGSAVLHGNSLTFRGLWALICGVLWVMSFTVAGAALVFDDLLGLMVSCYFVSRSYPQFALSVNTVYRFG